MKKDRTEARQGETGRRTLIVLAVSTAIALITAIAGFYYVESNKRTALDDPAIVDADVETADDAAQGGLAPE